MSTLRNKFHTYLEKYKTAIQSEIELGPDHEDTKNYFLIANQTKRSLQTDLQKAEEYLESLVTDDG
jgi:hypothetical protein